MPKPKKEKLRDMNPLSRKIKQKEAVRPPNYAEGTGRGWSVNHNANPIFVPKRKKR